MIGSNKIGNTPEELKEALIQLRDDFDAHNHDGVNSRSFETLKANVVSSQVMLIRKNSFLDNTSGIWMGLLNNVMKLFLGNGTSYLKWDGSNLSYTGKTRQTMKVSTIFETSGRFDQTVSGGAITFDTSGVTLDTTSTANRYARVNLSVRSGITATFQMFQGTAFSAVLTLAVQGANNGEFFIGVRDITGSVSGSAADHTVNHFGFKVVKTAGASALYATCGNGSTETTVFLLNFFANDHTFLAAVCDDVNGKVSFYAESANVPYSAEISTSVPVSTSGSSVLDLFAHNANTAGQYKWTVSSYVFEKFSGGIY